MKHTYTITTEDKVIDWGIEGNVTIIQVYTIRDSKNMKVIDCFSLPAAEFVLFLIEK